MTRMTDAQLSALLNELLALGGEMEWVEFKHNNANPEEIGQYIYLGFGEPGSSTQPRNGIHGLGCRGWHSPSGGYDVQASQDQRER